MLIFIIPIFIIPILKKIVLNRDMLKIFFILKFGILKMIVLFSGQTVCIMRLSPPRAHSAFYTIL